MNQIIKQGLYHFQVVIVLVAVFSLVSCVAPQVTQANIIVKVKSDGQNYEVSLPPGSTVKDAIEEAKLSTKELDRIEPPSYTILAPGDEITIIRVREEFEIDQLIIPFEQQLQPTEFLPEGEMQPMQLGENGLQELTYRIVYEDGEEISRSIIKSVIVNEANPQIMLVGVQASFTPFPINGRLVFLSDGNAWLVEETTSNRRPIVTTGDLDGYVFSLSPDGEWLLFTRSSEDEQIINTLWAVNINDAETLMDLKVENIIHFADWQPGAERTLVYSTVEPRQAPPGWQANNDLVSHTFSNTAGGSRWKVLIGTNSGGVYGWWGTNYSFSPEGERAAFANPDKIGVFDITEENQFFVMDIVPMQTKGDWAWVPSVRWGPDGEVIYTVIHAPPQGAESAEESPLFDIAAIPIQNGLAVPIVSQVGMFAYPLPSPIQPSSSGENSYQVAFLQAIIPTQSDSSRYRLVVMDRDGSNQKALFPDEGLPGIDPQREWGSWSPKPQQWDEISSFVLAIIYQENIWMVDTEYGLIRQVTGDGRIHRIDWR